LIDIEIQLVKAFNWSLKDIDDTDIESLIPFIMHFAGVKGEPVSKQRVHCDEVSWL